MTVSFSSDRAIAPSDLKRLLKQTDWGANRSEAALQIMLRGTARQVGAWQGEQLVGYARALTDGCFRAFIEDVVVDESLRGQGIGRALIENLLNSLQDIEEIRLACSDENVAFYEKLGFKRPKDNTLYIRRS